MVVENFSLGPSTYVPIDPKTPQERVQFIIKDSDSKLVLGHKQTQSISSEFSAWLDTVARAAIDVFIPNNERKIEKPPIWLVAPLVAKLPCEVQGRILKVAGQVLESTNSFGTKNKASENTENSTSSGRKRSVQINHQPFLGKVGIKTNSTYDFHFPFPEEKNLNFYLIIFDFLEIL